MVTIVLMVLLGACSSGEVPEVQQGRAIAFSSYTAEAVTRAEDVQRTIPKGSSIGVYAYYHDGRDLNSDGVEDAAGIWSDDATPNFMFNQQCTNRDEGESFVYAPLKYWPNEPYDKVSFIAYYPYTDASITNPEHPASPGKTGVTPLLANDGTGLPQFNFTVNDDVEKQVDFLVADLLPALPNGTQAITPSGTPDRDHLTVTDRVHFYFRHALAKVEFHIVAHPDIRPYFSKLKLNSLTINNIKNTGKLNLSYAPATGTGFTWDDLGATPSEPDAHTYTITVKEAYLLMPQDLADAATLKLDYELTLKGYNTVYTYDPITHEPELQDVYTYKNPNATVQLNRMRNTSSGAYVTKWEANRHYIYTIRLNADRIEFTGQVVDWGETLPIDGIDVKEE